MRKLITGETVLVSLRALGARDAHGNAVESWGEFQPVDNVLVGNGAADDVSAAPHATGIKYDATFYFPKGYEADLRGAKIRRGPYTFKVEGVPHRYTFDNIPAAIEWDMVVEAVATDG